MTTESSDNINRLIPSDIFNTLSFYRPVLEHPILKDFLVLSRAYESGLRGAEYRREYLDTYYHLKSLMLGYSFNKS